MREIKFRAWDGYRMTLAGIAFSNSTGLMTTPAKDILMQYTGLKDKNGKEIYEGDIIDEFTYIGWCDEFKIFSMVFSNIDGKPYCAQCGGDFMWQEFKHFPPEIIGNIHENPELVENE